MDIVRYETYKNVDIRRQRALLQTTSTNGTTTATNGTSSTSTLAPTPSPPAGDDDLHVNLSFANASMSVEWHTTFVEVASLSEVGYENGALFAEAFAADLASVDFTNKLLEVAGIDCLVWDVTASQMTASPSAHPTSATDLPSPAPSPAPPPGKPDGSSGNPASASSSTLLLGLLLAGAAFLALGLGGWRTISKRRQRALELKEAASEYNGQDPGLELSGLEPETEASLEAVMMSQHLDVDARATYLKRVQSAQAMASGNDKKRGSVAQFFSNPMVNNNTLPETHSATEGNGHGDGSGPGKLNERLAAQTLFNKARGAAGGSASSKQLQADAVAKADAAAKAGSFNAYGTNIGAGGGASGGGKKRNSVLTMYGADGRALDGFDDMVASSGAVGGSARGEAQRRYQEKMKSFKMAAAEPPSGQMGAMSLTEKLEAQDAAQKRAARPEGWGDVDEEGGAPTNVFDLDAVLGGDDDEDSDATVQKMATAAAYGQDRATDKSHAEDAARADSKFLQKLKARAEAGDAAAQAKLREMGHAVPPPPAALVSSLRPPSADREPEDSDFRPRAPSAYGTVTDL